MSKLDKDETGNGLKLRRLRWSWILTKFKSSAQPWRWPYLHSRCFQKLYRYVFVKKWQFARFSFFLLEYWLVSSPALAMTLRFVGKVVFSKEFDSTWLGTWRESPNNISLFISQTRPSQIPPLLALSLLNLNLGLTENREESQEISNSNTQFTTCVDVQQPC